MYDCHEKRCGSFVSRRSALPTFGDGDAHSACRFQSRRSSLRSCVLGPYGYHVGLTVLVERYLTALDLALADIRAGNHFGDQNFGILLAKVVPEILSRLCCKCSPKTQGRLLDFLTAVYRSDRRGHYRGIRNLAERLLEALSVHQRIAAIPRLLALPILADLNALEELDYRNPFMFLEIERDSLSSTMELDEGDLDRLIKSASSDNPKARRWAVLTLGKLHDWGLLGQWTDRSPMRCGIAWTMQECRRTRTIIDSGLLTLPHPTRHDPVSIFKMWVLNARFPVQAGRKSNSYRDGRRSHSLQ